MRYFIDAMNVIGARPDGWWRDRTGAIRDLIDRLERWSATEPGEITVVLERPMPITSTMITVAYAPAPAANSADDQIVRLVQAAVGDDIVVVTSDATLGDRVHALGAHIYPAGRFRDLLDRSDAVE